MTGWRKWFFYLFGAYNLIIGALAVVYTPLVASLYSVSTITPELMLASRWLGAMAMAIGYGAFSAAKSGDKTIINLLLIAVVATIIGSIWSLVSGDASFANVGFDTVLMIILIITALAPSESSDFKKMSLN